LDSRKKHGRSVRENPTSLNPKLVIVNGALGGMVANRIQTLERNKTCTNGRNIK
jgi:hypothetical protein